MSGEPVHGGPAVNSHCGQDSFTCGSQASENEDSQRFCEEFEEI